jgi:hypothetical protein
MSRADGISHFLRHVTTHTYTLISNDCSSLQKASRSNVSVRDASRLQDGRIVQQDVFQYRYVSTYTFAIRFKVPSAVRRRTGYHPPKTKSLLATDRRSARQEVSRHLRNSKLHFPP